MFGKKKKSQTLFVTQEDGTQIEYQIICTFTDDDTGKNYVVYTDMSKDSDGKVQLHASIYDKDWRLFPIETEDEWEIVEEVLGRLKRLI